MGGATVTTLRAVFKTFPVLQDTHLLWIIVTTAIYAPYFTFCMIIKRHRALIDRLHWISVPSVALEILFPWAASMPGDMRPKRTGTAFKITADELTTAANITAGFWIAKASVSGPKCDSGSVIPRNSHDPSGAFHPDLCARPSSRTADHQRRLALPCLVCRDDRHRAGRPCRCRGTFGQPAPGPQRTQARLRLTGVRLGLGRSEAPARPAFRRQS